MILTKENRTFIAESIDNAIKAKGLLELVDGMAASILLNVIDSYVDKKVAISDEQKEALNSLVEAVKAGEIEQAETIAAQILDSFIDIPGVEDQAESLLFEGAVKIIVASLLKWLKKDV